MPVATATALQRLTLRNEAVKLGVACQSFAQTGAAPGPIHAAAIDAQVTATLAAAADVGASTALPATSAVVTNGQAVTMQNSQGTAIAGTHTASVAANALSNVKLDATVATLKNGVKQSGFTVTGTGTFFTPTITNGVCTGGVLSAS
jgi:hypothetical protein